MQLVPQQFEGVGLWAARLEKIDASDQGLTGPPIEDNGDRRG